MLLKPNVRAECSSLLSNKSLHVRLFPNKASNKLQSNALKFIRTKDSLEGGFKSIKNKNPTNGK